MTTIRILIYTDSQDISDEDTRWSISILKSLIESQQSAFVEYKLEIINRYKDFPKQPETPQKLTDDLLKLYDEVWFFGTFLLNVEQAWEPVNGGRENELDDDEVKALERWMATGGVLMAGDHSIPDPTAASDVDPETFLCLGRALGHRVPRAGQLRKWVGPPTAVEKSSFNTLSFNLASDPAQEDAVPQVLSLVEGPGASFHRLLVGKGEQNLDMPITVFPDHRHEGEVVIPARLDSQWPPFDEPDESRKPRPEVIAYGCDKRFCRSKPVLAVYDGDALNVGRIVADASWHHYFNLNLRGLKDAPKNSVWPLLSQFYTNLALYLAPLSKRLEVGRAMFEWVMRHPEVIEEKGNNPMRIGAVALARLSEVMTRGELAELLQVILPAKIRSDDQFLDFPPLASGMGMLPPQELIIGSLIARRYRAGSAQLRAMSANESFVNAEESVDDAVAQGFKEALRSYNERLQQVADITKKYLDIIEQPDEPDV